MELSNVNLQVKAQAKDISSKASVAKGNENSFTKVYKNVSDKTNIDTAQTKVDAGKETENSVDNKANTSSVNTALDAKVEADTTKDDKDLNNLIVLLLMSQGTNQNLINLIRTNDNSITLTSTNEIKDLLTKMLKDNLEGTAATKANAANVKQTTNEDTSIDEIIKVLLLNSAAIDENSKKLTLNSAAVDETIDKLAANIANKLSTDNAYKENVLAEVLEKAQEPSIADNENTLKELIIKQLKTMADNETSISDNKNSKNSLSENLITSTSALKENISTNVLKLNNSNNSSNNNNANSSDDSNLSSSDSKTNSAAFKLYNASSDKEDKLLKQLTETDSSKSTKDNVSDKIANVLNRFETLKLDNQPLVEGKLSINKATFNEDFIKTVKFMDVNNLKELSVKVIPKDLGEVIIRLSMENGVMKANITATNKDTYNLLNSQLPAINSELAKQNMTIQNFSLSLYNGDNFLFSGDGSSNENGRQQNKNSIKVDNLEEDLQKENYIDDNSTVNLLA